nr:MAG TPA: hypothetical protein [Caudoviricetes sp.]
MLNRETVQECGYPRFGYHIERWHLANQQNRK